MDFYSNFAEKVPENRQRALTRFESIDLRLQTLLRLLRTHERNTERIHLLKSGSETQQSRLRRKAARGSSALKG